MSAANPAKTLDTCGCCETGNEVPGHGNRPGQAALRYRLGTHSSFLSRMLTGLSRQEIPDRPLAGQRPLAELSTRDPEDAAIAMLDAGAVLYDVLTFYQERIANEGYLRTAAERRSILELARAIGYELAPGVAAGTYLAFSVDDTGSTPDVAPIPAGTQIQSIPAAQDEVPQTFETSETFEARVQWNTLLPRTTEPHVIGAGTQQLYLEGAAAQLQPGDAIVIVGEHRQNNPGSERWDVRILQTVEPVPEANHTVVTWREGLGHQEGGVVTPPASDSTAEVYVFRQRAALFGFNAPDWRTMPVEVQAAFNDASHTEWPDFEFGGASDPDFPQVDLDAIYPRIVEESWLVLADTNNVELYRVDAVTNASRANFALTAKTTRVTLEGENLGEFDRRATVVYAQSERLERAEQPLTTWVENKTIELDRIVDGLQPGQPLIVSGKLNEQDEDPVCETVFIESAVHQGNHTTLILAAPLENRYVRSTVRIYGNVVAATHGETVSEEVLGGGDGAQTNQRFTLKKSPLTYVSAPTASGTASTLSVRVNRIAWAERPSLYGQAAADRVYTVRLSDNGDTAVIFGDGRSGARLPSGQENITAAYRAGLGREGEVGAGSLTLLKTRPFGIRSVTNPLAASGAADPETLDTARSNAPLTVLTLDRIVSLRDFEDFAQAFAGIGKAQAIYLWNGENTRLHLTIADDNGDAVPQTSDLYNNLSGAIDAARDPSVDVQIDSYTRLTFNLEANVLYDPSFIAEDVQAGIEAALRTAFSFDQRAFGQPVSAAEIISVIHGAVGVVAVDLEALYLVQANGQPQLGAEAQLPQISAETTLTSVLPARTARREGTSLLPAELLLINTLGIALTLRQA